jgi:hypothetical protein
MNYGSHLSTLIAVIVGLAVAELLGGASRTLVFKRTAGFSWLPFVQAIMIGTITLIFWIASYAELSSGKYLGIFAFATQLAAPALLYFAATRVFPPAQGDQSPNVHAHAVANARDVYIPPALWMVCTIVGNIYYFWPDWRFTLGPNTLCVLAVVSLLIAAGTRHDWLRWVATLSTEAIILIFVVIYLTVPS